MIDRPVLRSLDDLPVLLAKHRKLWVVYLGSSLDAQLEVTLLTWAKASEGRGRTIVWVDVRQPFTTKDSRVTAFRAPQLRYFSRGKRKRKIVGLTELRTYIGRRMVRWGYGNRT